MEIEDDNLGLVITDVRSLSPDQVNVSLKEEDDLLYCCFCTYRSFSRKCVENHLKIDHICSFCQDVFNEKDELLSHLKTNHTQQDSLPLNQVNFNSENSKNNMPKKRRRRTRQKPVMLPMSEIEKLVRSSSEKEKKLQQNQSTLEETWKEIPMGSTREIFSEHIPIDELEFAADVNKIDMEDNSSINDQEDTISISDHEDTLSIGDQEDTLSISDQEDFEKSRENYNNLKEDAEEIRSENNGDEMSSSIIKDIDNDSSNMESSIMKDIDSLLMSIDQENRKEGTESQQVSPLKDKVKKVSPFKTTEKGCIKIRYENKIPILCLKKHQNQAEDIRSENHENSDVNDDANNKAPEIDMPARDHRDINSGALDCLSDQLADKEFTQIESYVEIIPLRLVTITNQRSIDNFVDKDKVNNVNQLTIKRIPTTKDISTELDTSSQSQNVTITNSFNNSTQPSVDDLFLSEKDGYFKSADNNSEHIIIEDKTQAEHTSLMANKENSFVDTLKENELNNNTSNESIKSPKEAHPGSPVKEVLIVPCCSTLNSFSSSSVMLDTEEVTICTSSDDVPATMIISEQDNTIESLISNPSKRVEVQLIEAPADIFYNHVEENEEGFESCDDTDSSYSELVQLATENFMIEGSIKICGEAENSSSQSVREGKAAQHVGSKLDDDVDSNPRFVFLQDEVLKNDCPEFNRISMKVINESINIGNFVDEFLTISSYKELDQPVEWRGSNENSSSLAETANDIKIGNGQKEVLTDLNIIPTSNSQNYDSNHRVGRNKRKRATSKDINKNVKNKKITSLTTINSKPHKHIDFKLSKVHTSSCNPYAKQTKSFRRRHSKDDNNCKDGLEFSLDEEIKANKVSSLQHPYCNVCLLVKEHGEEKSRSELPESVEVPDQSELWMPAYSYSSPEIKLTTSPLIKCKDCDLVVHSSCYKGEFVSGQCDRCYHRHQNPDTVVTCQICNGKSGAFKNQNEIFYHIRCYLLIPELVHQQQIDLALIPKKRYKLSCDLCDQVGVEPSVHCQASQKCMVAFHLSCALKNNIDCVLNSEGHPIFRCLFCLEKFKLKLNEAESMSRFTQDLIIGEKIRVLNHPGIKQGIVTEVLWETVYAVTFDDGTTCDHLQQDDVTFPEGMTEEVNSKVTVLWEGNKCSGVFQKKNFIPFYKVQVKKDKSIIEVDRKDILKL